MRHRCRGYTLLEMMIVIVLIGVLLSMVSFTTGPNPARQARQEAHAFAGLVRQLREQAVLEGREYGIRLSEGGYRAMQLDVKGWVPVAPFNRWPETSRLRLSQDGHPVNLGADEGPPQLLMLSSDETSAFILSLASENKTWLSLSTDGIGEVLIDD